LPIERIDDLRFLIGDFWNGEDRPVPLLTLPNTELQAEPDRGRRRDRPGSIRRSAYMDRRHRADLPDLARRWQRGDHRAWCRATVGGNREIHALEDQHRRL